MQFADGMRYTASEGGRRIENEVLLADEAPIHELDELRTLIADGQERGFLTFDEISTALEEVEVTKEQVQELHGYLSEQGIDVVGADGRQASSEGARVEAVAEARKDARQRRRARVRRRSPSSISRSSRRWIRCGCTCARSAAFRC